MNTWVAIIYRWMRLPIHLSELFSAKPFAHRSVLAGYVVVERFFWRIRISKELLSFTVFGEWGKLIRFWSYVQWKYAWLKQRLRWEHMWRLRRVQTNSILTTHFLYPTSESYMKTLPIFHSQRLKFSYKWFPIIILYPSCFVPATLLVSNVA